MNSSERRRLLKASQAFFKDVIYENHIKNTKKLVDLHNFDINPFLVNYLAGFFKGDRKPETIAKVLVYPRLLGTSITTSFGSSMQAFISNVLGGYGSAITGIDIEFKDAVDGRKKYCQLKAGPNCINKDDIQTIKSHFRTVKGVARTNKLKVNLDDLVVGVLYGLPEALNAHYGELAEEYPVFVGKDFWYRLTGDRGFYHKLIDAIFESSEHLKADRTVREVLKQLSKNIKKNPDFFKGL